LDKAEEERLRELIRKELENREKMRDATLDERLSRIDASGLSSERERIIEEEIRDFYVRKGNYRPYENEDGDTEWLTETEIKEREIQIPVDMEELETGQKRVRSRAMLLVILFFFAVALVFLALREKTGSIQIICNVPGATISLDGTPTEFVTDFTFKGLSPGSHLVSVFKSGYALEGDANRRIDIQPGNEVILVFSLKPVSGNNLGR
jgi:hypothetical protein